MCNGCGSLTGFDLDAYAAALERAKSNLARRRFLAAVEADGHPGLVERLAPILDRDP